MRKDGWMAMACVVATCNRWVCILHDQQKNPKKKKLKKAKLSFQILLKNSPKEDFTVHLILLSSFMLFLL